VACAYEGVEAHEIDGFLQTLADLGIDPRLEVV
jgi:hypothetical protein